MRQLGIYYVAGGKLIMYLWTVQSKDVVDICRNDGVYIPDFGHSRVFEYINGNEINYYMRLLAFTINAFEKRNNIQPTVALTNMIFAFACVDKDGTVKDINYQSFKQMIKTHSYAIESLWNGFSKKSVLLKLKVNDSIDPCIMDINDWQYLMPPVIQMPPFDENSYEDILTHMLQPRTIYESKLPSEIYQALLPGIAYENIVEMYKLFEL